MRAYIFNPGECHNTVSVVWRFPFCVTLLVTTPFKLFADGTAIDKVYHPYVDALENEFEYRSIFQDLDDPSVNPVERHNLSFGKSIGDRTFGEFYLIGSNLPNRGFNLDAIEFELRWQLTEQGEYGADWGMLIEYEQVLDNNIQEFSTALFVEKEFGRLSATGNFIVTQEWGSDIKDEIETAFAGQVRYRYSRLFEPAVELYAGQNTLGLGPVLLGTANLGMRKNLIWEFGFIFGLDSVTPDETLRLSLEYEF